MIDEVLILFSAPSEYSKNRVSDLMAKWAGRVSWIQRPEVRIPGHDFFDVELRVGDSEYVEIGACAFGMRCTMSLYNACAGVSTRIRMSKCVACALSQLLILISALTPAQALCPTMLCSHNYSFL